MPQQWIACFFSTLWHKIKTRFCVFLDCDTFRLFASVPGSSSSRSRRWSTTSLTLPSYGDGQRRLAFILHLTTSEGRPSKCYWHACAIKFGSCWKWKEDGWIVANTQVSLTLLVLKGLALTFRTVGRCKLCIYICTGEREKAAKILVTEWVLMTELISFRCDLRACTLVYVYLVLSWEFRGGQFLDCF